MSLAYADEAIHLREAASLSDRDIARATGSGVSTVSAWLRRERAPRGRRAERLVELSAIADRLAAVLGAERVPVWLNKPVPALGHRKPLDVIADGAVVDRGTHEELLERCPLYAEIAGYGCEDTVYLQRDLEQREEVARL